MFVTEVLYLAFVEESIPIHVIHRPQLLQQKFYILLIILRFARATILTILLFTHCESPQGRSNHLVLLQET